MRIESYSFGVMKVDGKEYRQDLIVFPDKVRPNWWRKQGHSLAVEDVRDVIEFKPELLIVGTGDSGMMDIPATTEKALQDAGIEVIAKNTAQAYSMFNEQIKKGKNVVGAFHLTC
jgi:hypothetical protein